MPYLIVVIALSLIGNGVQAWLLNGASDKCALRVAQLERNAATRRVVAITTEADTARIDNQASLDRLAALEKQLENWKAIYRSAANANPLPIDCRIDAERVRAINLSRDGE